MTFDPTDKKYQVSEEFPPNKTETWKYPMEKDGEFLFDGRIPKNTFARTLRHVGW